MRFTPGSRLSLSLAAALAINSSAWGVEPTPYKQTNLVSDLPGVAKLQDPLLKNPWGISLSPSGGAFWVSNNHTGTTTLYLGDVNGSPFVQSPTLPSVTIPGAGGNPSSPTGQVFNGGTNLVITDGTNSKPALFLFAGEDGTVGAWNPSVGSPTPPSTTAKVPIDQSSSGASYTGVALANNGASSTVYLANNGTGKIDTFDGSFNPVTLTGSFVDPNLPTDLKPFNVQNINGTLYVTYVHDESAPNADEGGVIDRFDLSGNFLGRLSTDGALNRPWGLAMSPSDFGSFSNALLVGDEGDGRISAFDPVTGQFLGQLSDSNGQVIEIDELWGITFGNGVTAGDKNALYFASGLNDEENGLFGSIRVIPETNSLHLIAFGFPAMMTLFISRRKIAMAAT